VYQRAAADGNSLDFVAADFFTWEPPDKFDIIFDYTYVRGEFLLFIDNNSFHAIHGEIKRDDFLCWFNLHCFVRFFCALEPSMRPAWAKRIADLLKQDGELITLMYLV
jgi:hypothetical protein